MPRVGTTRLPIRPFCRFGRGIPAAACSASTASSSATGTCRHWNVTLVRMSNVSRWQPTDWNQQGRIVVTGPRIDQNDPTMAALQKAGYEPSAVPVRDDAGRVSTALGDADVVI